MHVPCLSPDSLSNARKFDLWNEQKGVFAKYADVEGTTQTWFHVSARQRPAGVFPRRPHAKPLTSFWTRLGELESHLGLRLHCGRLLSEFERGRGVCQFGVFDDDRLFGAVQFFGSCREMVRKLNGSRKKRRHLNEASCVSFSTDYVFLMNNTTLTAPFSSCPNFWVKVRVKKTVKVNRLLNAKKADRLIDSVSLIENSTLIEGFDVQTFRCPFPG